MPFARREKLPLSWCRAGKGRLTGIKSLPVDEEWSQHYVRRGQLHARQQPQRTLPGAAFTQAEPALHRTKRGTGRLLVIQVRLGIKSSVDTLGIVVFPVASEDGRVV